MNKFQEPLEKLFDKHRIIFWYDEEVELLEEFNSVDILCVEKIVVSNNEFSVKYKISREFSDKKFLLYFEGREPDYLDDWLLDIKLANYTFHTTPEAIVLQELGLDYRFREFIKTHKEFFKSKSRTEKFKKLLIVDIVTEYELRMTILKAVITGEAISIEDLILKLFSISTEKQEKLLKDLNKYNISDYFWLVIKKEYNYQSESPSLYELAIELFKAVTSFVSGDTLISVGSSSASNAILARIKHIISNWKHDTKSFVEYSRKVQDDLHIKKTLNNGIDIKELASEDQYDEIEKYIITQLIDKLNNNLISLNDVEDIIKQREQSFFYEASVPFYETILNGAKLQWEIESLKDKISIDDLESWGNEYSKRLYKVDLHYRNFIHSYKQTKQNPVLQELFDKYHNLYSNDWLLPLNDNWQKTVDNKDTWNTTPGKRQRDFYYYNVKPLIDKGQKAVVIISDAFRYEIGDELNSSLNAEMVYESKIDHLYSELPSYTQLGMASLLPNSELEIKDDCNVLVDDMNSDGTPNRSKILTQNSGVQSLAISYKEFMKLNPSKEGRALLKENKLVYIYHNRIDKTGDDKTTEEDVFSAVNQSITELKDLLKNLYSANTYNYFITSDHGFIYQAKLLEKSDYVDSCPTGDIWKQNRRFFIGKNLENHPSYKKFTANDLGQNGDYICMFPKSINRIPVKGAGSKFVHGGTSLQEVIIPVLRINRKVKAIRSLVDIDIIKGKEEISSSIKPISFIQSKPVGDKQLPRTIKAAFYNDDKTVIISNEFKFTFDSTDSLERQREKKFTFHLSSRATDEFNNQKVLLILNESIEGTSRWKEYSTYDFRMSISSTIDFDF